MIEEEFKAVKGYEGLYEVSNLGRVRSLKYGKGRVLCGSNNGAGYLQVVLSKNSKRKDCAVHRLVAEAFIPNPDGLPQINHIDEDKTNNCVWNLEWCDVKYNINYGTGIERSAEKRGKRVYQYTLSGSFVRSYTSTREAERQTGIRISSISDCCNGKRNYKSAGNYRWSYDPPTPITNRVLF